MDKQHERRSITAPIGVETREGDEAPVIQGYAALFDVETVIYGLFRESIAPGAFKKSIESGRRIVSLFNHNPDVVLGSTSSGTMKLREDSKGLWIEVEAPNTQTGRDVVESIRRGDVEGQSFMFQIRKQEWTFATDSSEMDVRRITEIELYEAGPVLFPAYEDTSVAVRSTAEEQYRAAREEWERQNRPAEPVVVKGLYPEVVIARVNALRLRHSA